MLRNKNVVCFGLFVAVVMLWVGCSAPPEQTNDTNTNNQTNSNEPLDYRVKVPTPPAKGEGLQFKQPETIIKAGEEKQVCWIPNWVPEKDYYIRSFNGFQSKMGHHVVALRSAVPRKAGTQFDCTSLEQMTAIRPLILPDLPNRPLLPKGYAVHVSKGTKIVIQSHYVNTSSKDIKVADVAHINFYTAKEPPNVASYFILNHGAIDLPTGKSKVDVKCKVENNMNILVLLGHMHEYGTSINIKMSGSASKMLYNIPKWNVDMRDNPPIDFFGPLYKGYEGAKTSEKLEFKKGDQIDLHCEYDNTTKGNLTFPAEMCTMVAYYHSKETNKIITCDSE